jgi:hypothetical protein
VAGCPLAHKAVEDADFGKAEMRAYQGFGTERRRLGNIGRGRISLGPPQ